MISGLWKKRELDGNLSGGYWGNPVRTIFQVILVESEFKSPTVNQSMLFQNLNQLLRLLRCSTLIEIPTEFNHLILVVP